MVGSQQIAVLEGSPRGPGSIVHLWSNLLGDYRRLCDGIGEDDGLVLVGQELARDDLACLECYWVFRADQECPHPRLSVLARSLLYLNDMAPTIPAFPTVGKGRSVESGKNTLNTIPLHAFADFYAADDDEKDRVIERFRARGSRRGGNYYQPVLGLLRSEHWRVGNLSRLESAIPAFVQEERAKDVNNPNRRDRAPRYEKMLEAYLAFCIQARVSNTFAAFARTNVHVNNDVAISVSPTIGMRIGATDHVLVLSMRKCSPNRHFQQAVNFFLGRAITAHPAYLGCRTGLLDVKEKAVRYLLATTSAEEQDILDQAVRFHQMTLV